MSQLCLAVAAKLIKIEAWNFGIRALELFTMTCYKFKAQALILFFAKKFIYLWTGPYIELINMAVLEGFVLYYY
jgi:hypothetical protein